MELKKDGLLEIIAEHRTGKNLDKAVRKDNEYQEALTQQKEVFDRMDALELTAEQKKVIDCAITANNHVGAMYGEVAYRIGMEDGIRLRLELEEIMRLSQ